MLKLKNTPGFSRGDLVMTYAKHKQVGQHRNTHGFLATVFVPTDLMLAQAQTRFEFPVHQLDCPTLLVDAYDLARCQFGQIGHQDLGLFGADVTPSFAQHHSDIPHMTQVQARMIRPKGLPALSRVRSGDAGALVILLRHMGHEIFERFLLHGLPGPGDRKDKAPTACRIGFVPVLDHTYVGLGAIGSIPAYDHQLRPTWWDKLLDHVAK